MDIKFLETQNQYLKKFYNDAPYNSLINNLKYDNASFAEKIDKTLETIIRKKAKNIIDQIDKVFTQKKNMHWNKITKTSINRINDKSNKINAIKSKNVLFNKDQVKIGKPDWEY